MAYNPFNKELHSVEWQDLQSLNDVSEGFYVDYKEQLSQNNSKTAKEISSFANTDGGLLIVGVREANDNTAGAFLGVDIQSQDPKVKIRNIIQSRLSPPPRFKIFIVEKNNDPTKGVVIVSVPKSKDAPHVTNDGRIYRRTGEGSDPYEYETDAKMIDRLHRRGEKFYQEMSEFCVPDTGVTKGKSGNAFMEIYAVPSTKETYTCSEIVHEVSDFKEIAQNRERNVPISLESDDDVSISIENENFFDSIISTSDGVTAQKWVHKDRRGNKDYAYAPLTFKFFANGSVKIRFPVPTIFPPEPQRFEDASDFSLPWGKIYDKLDDEYLSVTYLDGENLMNTTLLLLDLYLDLLEQADWFEEYAGTLYFKGIIRDSFRSMLLFDKEWYEEVIEENGPPISYDQGITIPQMDYLELDSTDEAGIFMFRFCQGALSGLGLPHDHLSNIWKDLAQEEN